MKVARDGQTLDAPNVSATDASQLRPRPGVVIVYSRSAPTYRIHALPDGGLVLGRSDLSDPLVSRDHVEVSFSGSSFRVRDLESRNGTWVDGTPVNGVAEGALRVLRVGDTVALLTADLDRLAGGVSVEDEIVVGPGLRRVLERVASVAALGGNLLITGETGSGKELAARRFHRDGPHARGPLVTINCATIPAGLAERLLFGARRGAYSGADADAEGQLQAADGGVLFLDEIAELEPGVQAKLLRVLETRELLPLGAVKPRRVDFKLCAATHRDLRALSNEEKFRSDLFYRLAHSEVRMPPLRERAEEIAALVAHAVAAVRPDLTADARLVEACLLRPWPGNVRELLAAARSAAAAAIAAGSTAVRRRHLDGAAGLAPGTRADAVTPTSDVTPPSAPRAPAAATRSGPSAADVQQALAAAGGNVSAAARALGIHRVQLYRVMKRLRLRIPHDDR